MLLEHITEYLTKIGFTQEAVSAGMAKVVAFILSIIIAIVIWMIGHKIIKHLIKGLCRFFEKKKVDPTVTGFLKSLLQWLMYAVLIFLIVEFLGVPSSSLVAALGSLGLTLGLALQGSLSNFAGGLLILLFKPFRVGDYIIESSQKEEALVTKIEILYTTLLTYDNRSIIIPNGALSSSSIVNLSLEPVRRVEVAVGVEYGSDLAKARNALVQMMTESDLSRKDRPIEVVVNELKDSSIDLRARCWTDTKNYWTMKYFLTENVKLCLDEAGVNIAFPQLDVHLPQKESSNS